MTDHSAYKGAKKKNSPDKNKIKGEKLNGLI